MKPMYPKFNILPAIVMCLILHGYGTVSSIAAEDSAQSHPKTLSQALDMLEKHLSQGLWVNITFDDNPAIQREIIDNIGDIIRSERFFRYVPLMNKDTLEIARNAFYARRGHKFSKPRMEEHFRRYSWYKPNPNGGTPLTEPEKKYVGLLRQMESNWPNPKVIPETYDDDKRFDPIPGGEVIGKNGKRYLKLKDNLIDISPYEIKERCGSYEDCYSAITVDYQIRHVPEWRSVIVCREETHPMDGIPIFREISCYSSNGTKTATYKDGVVENKFLSMSACPTAMPHYPDILFCYYETGCCGPRGDYLILFDRNLRPVSTIDCPDQSCEGSFLFEDAASHRLYFYTSTEIYSNNRVGYRIHIHAIQQDGSTEIVAETPIDKETSFYPGIFLYKKKTICHFGRIVSSFRHNGNLILFWEYEEYEGTKRCVTTVVPLKKKSP